MATTFYLGSVGTPPISPSFDAGWDKTSSATRLVTHTDNVSTAMTTTLIAETSASTPYDVLFGQFVSHPIATQTISGTILGQIRALESDTAADAMYAIVVKVVSADGTTVRGTLLSDYPAALASEFATGTLTNRKWPASTSVSSVNALEGDRIVIEIGVRFHNSTSASKSASVRFGDAGGSDLPVDETGTTDLNPYIQFSQNIIFSTALAISSVISNAQTNVATSTVTNIPCRGTNRALIYLVSTFDSTANARNLNTVTFNSVGLTQITESDTGSGEHTEAWRLINPAATTASLVSTTVSGNADVISIGAVMLINAHQVNVVDASLGEVETSENPMSIALSTIAGGAMVFSICNIVTTNGAVPGASQTQYHSSDSGYIVASYSGPHASAQTITHTYNNGTSDTAAMVIVSVKPVPVFGKIINANQAVNRAGTY